MVGLLMVVSPLFRLRLTRMLARVGSVGGSLLTALLHNLTALLHNLEFLKTHNLVVWTMERHNSFLI